MNNSDIHKIFLQAAIEASKKGATAKELAGYLKEASQGMQINAAFRMSADDLLTVLLEELKSQE